METRRKRRQQRKTVEDLYDAILLKIFDFLIPEDLERAGEVCQRWQSLIASSTKLVRKLCLVIQCDEPDGLLDLLDTYKKFKFRSFVLKFLEPRTKPHLMIFEEVLKHHKDHIEKLRVKTFDIDLLMYLLVKSDLCANLTHLSVMESEPARITRSLQLDFPNLKYLRAHYASEFINHIKSHKIESIFIEDSDSDLHTGNWVEFFKTCSNLKELAAESNLMYNFDLTQFEFKLERFETLDNKWNETEEDKKAFRKFLRSQRESLKHLKLHSCGPEFFNFVLNELKVETFHVIYKDYSRPKLIAEDIKSNFTIKRINYDFTSHEEQNIEYFKKLIFCLKAVESFDIELRPMNDVTILNFIAVSMPKLRELTFTTCEGNAFAADSLLKIEQVERLTIKSLPQELIKRISLLTCCPNVKILSIGAYTEHIISCDDLEMLIMSLEKLEELFVYGNLQFNDNAIDLILQSNLHKITIVDDEGTQELPKRLKDSKVRVIVRKCDWRDEQEKYEDFGNIKWRNDHFKCMELRWTTP